MGEVLVKYTTCSKISRHEHRPEQEGLPRHFVEERFEVGTALEGWEVKAIRAGHVQLKEVRRRQDVEIISSAAIDAVDRGIPRSS
jgi:tmRNA-binding protein